MCCFFWWWRSTCWANSVFVFEVKAAPPITRAEWGVAGPSWRYPSRRAGERVRCGAWVGLLGPYWREGGGEEVPLWFVSYPCPLHRGSCRVGCQLSSPSLSPLGPKVTFGFCSLVWFPAAPLAPQLQNLQQVVSFESWRWKSLSWACAADKCAIDGKPLTGGYPIPSLAKRHFQKMGNALRGLWQWTKLASNHSLFSPGWPFPITTLPDNQRRMWGYRQKGNHSFNTYWTDCS